MPNFMTTCAIKYGDFSRITTLLVLEQLIGGVLEQLMEYYYPQHLPGGTHLFSPSFCERETVRFHVAACKDKSMDGLRVFCSLRCGKKQGT